MKKTITAVFDGRVLRPDSTLELEPNIRYRITIEDTLQKTRSEEDAWDVLEGLSGTVMAPTDWSSEHDHYLYGTKKHQAQIDIDSNDK